MEQKMISSKAYVNPDMQVQPISVLVASSQNFLVKPESGEHNKHPLMVNAWSQTTSNDFSILKEIENIEHKSQREKILEEKIRLLEENLKAHTELLSQIHATSAKRPALLGQQHSQNHEFTNNNSNKTSQLAPKIVNSINTIQQVSSPSAESVKYTIIAEGAGNNNDEPIEIELAEDDGALNLNSSADSGRLEICLAPEENIANVEVKTECNTHNNTMNMQQQAKTPTSDPTPSEYSFIKKRKLAVEQQELLSSNSKCCNEETFISSNSLLKKNNEQHIRSNHIETTPKQNMIPSPEISNNTQHQNCGNDISQVAIDTDRVMVSIGPNNTSIPAKVYENINWTSASIATRKLLMSVFRREVLATHSMTGKPSPAFKDHGKPIKQMLDPRAIADIIFAVTRRCNVSEKEVRNAITTKCADENKMMKLQMNKRTPMRERNKENLVG